MCVGDDKDDVWVNGLYQCRQKNGMGPARFVEWM